MRSKNRYYTFPWWVNSSNKKSGICSGGRSGNSGEKSSVSISKRDLEGNSQHGRNDFFVLAFSLPAVYFFPDEIIIFSWPSLVLRIAHFPA